MTHTDGHQSVQEIKNDFGMNGTDVDAMIAKLVEQGVSILFLPLKVPFTSSYWPSTYFLPILPLTYPFAHSYSICNRWMQFLSPFVDKR